MNACRVVEAWLVCSWIVDLTLVGAPADKVPFLSPCLPSSSWSSANPSMTRLMGSKKTAQMRFQTRAPCDANDGTNKGAKQGGEVKARAGGQVGRAGWQVRGRTEWRSGGGRFGAAVPRFSCPRFGSARGLRRSSKRSPWRIGCKW